MFRGNHTLHSTATRHTYIPGFVSFVCFSRTFRGSGGQGYCCSEDEDEDSGVHGGAKTKADETCIATHY